MIAHPIHVIPEQKYEVTPLELFFDLVFAFAVSQLSLYLLTHLSWRGAAETLVMMMAIFTVWFTTSWSATMIRADQSRTRWLVLGVMLLGLFMNASVTMAFTTSGWAFVIPLLLIQLGRTVWTLINSTNTVLRDHYFRTLLWVIATTPLWDNGRCRKCGSPLAVVGAGRRDRSDRQVIGASHSWPAAAVRERRVRRGSYVGTLSPVPAHCARGNGAHHGHGYFRSFNNRDNPSNEHVRACGNNRPLGAELRAFPSAHPLALGEDKCPHSRQSPCGKRSDGNGHRTHRHGGRE